MWPVVLAEADDVGELLAITDSDHARSVTASDAGQRRVRQRRVDTRDDRRRLGLEDLLRRPCRCKLDCYRQFADLGGLAGLRGVRDSFQKLDENEQDLHISLWILGRGSEQMMARPAGRCSKSEDAGEILPVSEPENAGKRHYAKPELAVVERLGRAPARQDMADAVGILDRTDGSADEGGGAGLTDAMEFGDGNADVAALRPLRRAPVSSQLLGRQVCVRALVSLLGVGHSRVERIRKLHRSLRHQPQIKHPLMGQSLRVSSRSRWPGILMFFWFLYHVIAENLPEKPVSMSATIRARVATWDEGHDDSGGSDEEDRERHMQQMVLDMSPYGPSAGPDEAGEGPGTLKGPRRPDDQGLVWACPGSLMLLIISCAKKWTCLACNTCEVCAARQPILVIFGVPGFRPVQK